MTYRRSLAVTATALTAYGLPITRRTVLVGAGALCAYPLWPVVAADVQLAAGITTAGLLHRAVSSVGLPLAAHAFWAIAAAVGASLAAGFGARTWRAVHHDRDLADGLLCVTVLWFLLLMPFSYMYRERVTFMPVLPFASLAIVQVQRRERRHPERRRRVG